MKKVPWCVRLCVSINDLTLAVEIANNLAPAEREAAYGAIFLDF